MYLKAAQWGIDALLKEKPHGYQFRFYIIGVLASLRAVQHALLNHDATLSSVHRKVIDEWRNDPHIKTSRELAFIKMARDLILKEGNFSAWAASSETEGDYDLSYWIGEERYDLLADLRSAETWCERELTSIAAKLPEPVG